MVKPSEPSLKIVPRPCLRLVTVRKGYVRLPSRACLPEIPSKPPLAMSATRAPAPTTRTGQRVTDDPIGDAREGERLFSPLRRCSARPPAESGSSKVRRASTSRWYPSYTAGNLPGVVFATRQWEGLVYEPFLRSGLEAAILALLHSPKHFAGHLIAQNPPDEALGESSSSGPATSPSPRPRR